VIMLLNISLSGSTIAVAGNADLNLPPPANQDSTGVIDIRGNVSVQTGTVSTPVNINTSSANTVNGGVILRVDPGNTVMFVAPLPAAASTAVLQVAGTAQIAANVRANINVTHILQVTAAAVNVVGDVHVNKSATVTISGAGASVEGNVQVDSNAVIALSGSNIDVIGDVNVDSNAHIVLNGSSAYVSGTLTSAGNVTLTQTGTSAAHIGAIGSISSSGNIIFEVADWTTIKTATTVLRYNTTSAATVAAALQGGVVVHDQKTNVYITLKVTTAAVGGRRLLSTCANGATVDSDSVTVQGGCDSTTSGAITVVPSVCLAVLIAIARFFV